ncbi:MAG: N-acetylmuramoyl-L-alanine amidase [Elusimicrobiota bacterium]
MRIKNQKYIFLNIFLVIYFFILTFSNAESLMKKVIVIDPGHGCKKSHLARCLTNCEADCRAGCEAGCEADVEQAKDEIVNYGCKSAGGTKEMDVVIDISDVLEEMFLQEGVTTYFTRSRKNYWRYAKSQDDDNQLRAEFANLKKADLFLRIHCNWSSNKKKRGVLVMWYKEDSKKIAETVYQKIKKSGIIVDGIRKQHLMGFEFAKVPSILIEYGYLSNKDDSKLLNDKKYIEKVSSTIIDGLKEYFSAYQNHK